MLDTKFVRVDGARREHGRQHDREDEKDTHPECLHYPAQTGVVRGEKCMPDPTSGAAAVAKLFIGTICSMPD